MRFDQTDLRVFIQACEQGSLTAASAGVHLTLAAVSARMRRLEQQAGGALLQRHARGVTPTPAGRRLLAQARAALDGLDGFRAGTQEDPAPGPSRDDAVVVLANTSALARWPGAPLAELVAAHPQLRMTVRESTSHRSVPALQRRQAQLALVSDAVTPRDLSRRRIGADPLVAVLPLGHPLAQRLSLRLDELCEWPWIALPHGRALTDHLQWQASRGGRVLPLRVQVPELAQVVGLVASGAGVSVLPQLAVEKLQAASRVRMVGLDDAWARRQLLLCTPPSGSRRLQRFADDLVAALQAPA